uniref:Uncharacterized protein n=1 Tax=Helianthus annuus TaxID=4232 RepID=A0A251U1S3_HELAN
MARFLPSITYSTFKNLLQIFDPFRSHFVTSNSNLGFSDILFGIGFLFRFNEHICVCL